jgi:hypothetical protein
MSITMNARGVLCAAVAILMAACASSGSMDTGTADATDEQVVVRVTNDGGTSDLTVSLEGMGGPETLLGTVPEGQTATFTVDVPAAGGEFTLVASAPDAMGEEVVSDAFTLEAGATVSWDVDDNRVNVSGGGPGGAPR